MLIVVSFVVDFVHIMFCNFVMALGGLLSVEIGMPLAPEFCGYSN